MLTWSIVLLNHDYSTITSTVSRHLRSLSVFKPRGRCQCSWAVPTTLHCPELALYHTRYLPNHSATVAYDCAPGCQELTASQRTLPFAVDCCVRYFRHHISDIDLSLALRGPSPTILFTILRGQQSILRATFQQSPLYSSLQLVSIPTNNRTHQRLYCLLL